MDWMEKGREALRKKQKQTEAKERTLDILKESGLLEKIEKKERKSKTKLNIILP